MSPVSIPEKLHLAALAYLDKQMLIDVEPDGSGSLQGTFRIH
jgi:hypothetical protein